MRSGRRSSISRKSVSIRSPSPHVRRSTASVGSEGSIRVKGVASGDVRKQCGSLRRGELWIDEEFGGDQALYRNGVGHKFNNGQRVHWLRPHELKGASESQIALIKDGIEAGDVQQGELGNCYLLGAMSSIAAAGTGQSEEAAGTLFRRLLASGRDATAELRLGFITFMLYKFGEWVELTVDTLIPCNEQGEPIFAHSKDPNELWVSMLEKAYAKLHGSYEALDGGSVTAALTDLTGGIAETIDLQDEDERQELLDGSMWRRLLRYSARSGIDDTSDRGVYLLGAALSEKGVPDEGVKSDVQHTDLGILVNHAYTLLDVREFNQTRLLKLRNPWGMCEWEGAWGDNKPEWDTALGREIMSTLRYQFKDDGTFWMNWEDFQEHFNRVYVCRVFDYIEADEVTAELSYDQRMGRWCRYDVESAWTTECAGGCFNFPSWRQNPQFEFRTGEPTHALFLLMQPDPRMHKAVALLGGDEGGPKYDHKIGMYVMKGHDRLNRKVLFDSEEIDGDDVVDSTPYMEYREVQCNTMDEEKETELEPNSPFVLCPSTFAPSKYGDFRIAVFTERPLVQPPTLLPPLRELTQMGAWTETTAGGCRNFYTWRRNQQYVLRVEGAARVSVVLMRHDEHTIRSDKPLLAKKARRKGKSRRNSDATQFYIGFSVVKPKRRGRIVRPLLHVDEEEIIDKTSYTLNFEAGREFVSDGPTEYVIIPTTFEPGKKGDFEIHVYTDDERASLAPLMATGWLHTRVNGEWTRRSSGGCRNHPTWVLNPMYSLRPQRNCEAYIFLRQPERTDEAYEGIGFYVTYDDKELNIEDLVKESGFRSRIEVQATVERLDSSYEYLLLPMTYRKGVLMQFEIEIFSDQPVAVTQLSTAAADRRRQEAVERQAARTIQRWMARRQIRQIRRAEPGVAREMMLEWFSKPTRDNDDGYVDINLALNALEAAFIQLTGRDDAKGTFFPRMRERLQERGHVTADYDVCL